MMREPFSSFHQHYDAFMMKYVDYKGWVEYLERIFRRFHVRPRTILDVACGTGIPSILLARRGYRVTGVDRSPEMLSELAAKKGDLPIATVLADMREFTLAEPLDAAICLYDSMNYLLTEEDLLRCFVCVRRALTPGGIFAFDMNTVYGLAEFWGTRSTTREVGGVYSIWQNAYDAESRVSTLHLAFWETPEPGVTGPRYDEIHQERAYRPAEVEHCLRAGGFAEAHFYQHGGFSEPGPFTTRIMVVAR